MLFKDWLNQFAGVPEDMYGDSVSVGDVLQIKYESLRYIDKWYSLVDPNKKRFADDMDKDRWISAGFNRMKSDYKNVKLLVNSDTDKDGSTNGWFYRRYTPAPKIRKKVKERLSLNVYMAPGLINNLDEIVNDDKGEHISEYKTPSGIKDWAGRYDPITIYFYDLTPELLQKIVIAVKPYLRPERKEHIVETKNPYGIVLPKSVYYNKEYSREEVADIFNQIKKYFPAFEREARDVFDFKRENKLSLGQVYVLKQFQKQFAKDIGKIDKKSIENYIKSDRDKIRAFLKANKKITDKIIESEYQKQITEDNAKLEAFIQRFHRQ